MTVTVEYAAQVRTVAGVSSEAIEPDGPSTLQSVVNEVANRHGDAMRTLLFKDDGTLHPSILLFLGDDQLHWDGDAPVDDGAVLTILSPVSGG